MFQNWLENKYAQLIDNHEIIFDFHRFKTKDNHGIEIDRNGILKTVSITTVNVTKKN